MSDKARKTRARKTEARETKARKTKARETLGRGTIGKKEKNGNQRGIKHRGVDIKSGVREIKMAGRKVAVKFQGKEVHGKWPQKKASSRERAEGNW